MNIFYTDKDPSKCARNLDDKRVNKMIVESCQMLSTALVFYGVEHEFLYKPCYVNHPCSKWVRESVANFAWLSEHTEALIVEFGKRFGNYHNSEVTWRVCSNNHYHLPKGRLTPHPNCTPYKDERDTILAYRKTMIDKWNNDINPKWTNSKRPSWSIV